jgi:hypothetical protein
MLGHVPLTIAYWIVSCRTELLFTCSSGLHQSAEDVLLPIHHPYVVLLALGLMGA